jgi:hypothetical protein
MHTGSNRMMSRVLAVATLCAAGLARADDSEIYLGSTQKGSPYVMMTLDLRSNLFAKVGCLYGDDLGDGQTYCQTEWDNAGAPEIYDTMKLHNEEFGLGYVQGEELSIFDAMRAIFGVVFNKYNDYYFGMMISHDSTTGNSTYKSDGAYILNGFQQFEAGDGNHAKRELLRKLYSIPEPS